MYSVAAPRNWLSQTDRRAAGPARAAVTIAMTPMMFDWMVKKLKKLATLLPLVTVSLSWVTIAATTVAAISSRSALPMARPVMPSLRR